MIELVCCNTSLRRTNNGVGDLTNDCKECDTSAGAVIRPLSHKFSAVIGLLFPRTVFRTKKGIEKKKSKVFGSSPSSGGQFWLLFSVQK